MAQFGPLVSTDWLADRLADERVRIIDGSWRMPGAPPARQDYERRHIPGAAFFDIDDIADRASPLPHMLPLENAFGNAVGALGVSNDHDVVVYDDRGLFSAARVWWTFRAMGHDRVAVLDGGLPKWRAEGRPVTDDRAGPKPATFRAPLQPHMVCCAAEVRGSLDDPDVVIADARPAARFCGEAPEPRPGLRSGHMPGAKSVPHTVLLTPDGGLRPAEEIEQILRGAGIDLDKRIVTTCGSGVTAAVLSLALEIVGCRRHTLYDGSWAEWGDERHTEEEHPVIDGN